MIWGIRTVPWFRWIVVGLLPQRPKFEVDKVAWGRVFLEVLLFSPFSNIPPVLHTHSCINQEQYVTSALDSIIKNMLKKLYTVAAAAVIVAVVC
jgi:hypothetical protein